MIHFKKELIEIKKIEKELKGVIQNMPKEEACFEELKAWGEGLLEDIFERKEKLLQEEEEGKRIFEILQKLEKDKYDLSFSEVYKKIFYVYNQLLNLSKVGDSTWALFYEIHFAWHFPIVEEMEEKSPFPNFYQALQEGEKQEKEAKELLFSCKEELQNVVKQKGLQGKKACRQLKKDLVSLIEIAKSQFYEERVLEKEELCVLYSFLGEDALFINGKDLTLLIIEKLEIVLC